LTSGCARANIPAMAKGYEANAERVRALQALGKDLARRARSRCELCGTGGVPLAPFEVPPVQLEPDLERTALLCEGCRQAIGRPAALRGQQWRCLVDVLWGELPVTQVLALRMLERLAGGEDWAREALDLFTAEPELREWADAAPL